MQRIVHSAITYKKMLISNCNYRCKIIDQMGVHFHIQCTVLHYTHVKEMSSCGI